MIEILATIIISYALGFGSHWYITPEKVCKDIKLDIPTKYYSDPLSIKPCPAGIDSENRYHDCYVDMKLKYVYTPNEQEKIEEYLLVPAAYLNQCVQKVNEYNNDKFIKSYEELKKEFVELKQVNNELKDLSQAINETEHFKNLLMGVGNALPDMLWAKDLDGKYLYANRAIREQLLFSGDLEDTIGHSDIYFAVRRRQVVGEENHTFGELCASSDDIVLVEKTPMKFLEYGIVSGKEMKLIVHKNVLRNSLGDIVGTVGTARDVTAEFKQLEGIIKSTNCEITKKKIERYMKQYEFKLNDSVPMCSL